jgi:hypothetical protein
LAVVPGTLKRVFPDQPSALVGPVEICPVKARGLAAERIFRISERPVGAIDWPVLAGPGRGCETHAMRAN